MNKIYILLAFIVLISVNFNVVLSQNNYKLHGYGDADSDAALLVTEGTYGDAQTAQRAIYHNDVVSPWKFGTYEFATKKFFIYTATNAAWQGSQWQTLNNLCPMVYEGHSFVNNTALSPVIFFVAPDNAIYRVSTDFEYQSPNGTTAGYTFFQFKAKGGSLAVNMNFGKNYTPTNRKLVSDFFVNLHAGDTITFNQTYTTPGDPFCQWTKLQVSGNNGSTAFTSTEANESGFYFDNYLAGTDFSYLNTKITTSENLIGSAVPGTTLGTYPASAIILFQNAVNAAKNFVSNQPGATQLTINTQLATLSTAYSTFTNSKKSSVIATDEVANEYKLASGVYLIRLKGTEFYLTAPTAKGTTSTNRTTYQTLRDAGVQNCQKWSIQYNRNSGFTVPPRYSFVSGIDGNANWSEDDVTNVGHLDEAGYFRDKNTEETQTGDEGIYHNFTVYYNGTTYGLNDAGLNRSLNISASVIGETLEMSYGTTGPIQFVYEFLAAPNESTAVILTGINKLRIINVENGIQIITDKALPVSVYNLAGIKIKNCIVNSDEVISLTRGAYIVKSGNTVQKVIVK